MKQIQLVFQSKIIIFFLLISSSIYCDDIWKISTSWGENLSCTEIIGISNDSLHTEILGKYRSFAITDINKVTSFNKKVNMHMVIGSAIGGLGGFVADRNLDGNQKRNGILFTIAGLITGTLSAHIISVHDSIDLTKMKYPEKKQILVGLFE